MNARPITIIGGGLAGLSLGVGLRQRGIPVRIWEKGSYPRHRVCGEFIRGQGLNVIDKLGLKEILLNAGAVYATRTAFVFTAQATNTLKLEPPALCLSRYRLDSLLAQVFRGLGGELIENTGAPELPGHEGVVRTNGRQAVPVERGWRWFGLKVHATDVAMSADLEMHCFRQAYIGLTRIENGKVNVCGLFRRRSSQTGVLGPGRQFLFGEPGSILHQKLSAANIEANSFRAVAGLSFKRRRAAYLSDCTLGDALTMIPPVTGNGMSMALEAAEKAIDPVARYSDGSIGWDEARAAVAAACDRQFMPRLRWARWLQSLLFFGPAQSWLGCLLLNSEWAWNQMLRRTR